MKIDRIDHLVLTVASIETTCDFYQRVLGFERDSPPGKPTSLRFGHQKINVHQADRTFDPKALQPTPGAADFCLITDGPIANIVEHMGQCGITIEKGPIARTGSIGPMISVYFRDPDGNLVEIGQYQSSEG